MKFSGRDILLGVTRWLNDSLMDAVQKLIYKSMSSFESWQSVLNWQKKYLFPKWKKITFNYCMEELTIGTYRSTHVVKFRYMIVYGPTLAAA